MTAIAPSLFVDLDGTLIAGDTLKLSVAALLRHRPHFIVPLGLAVLRGRSRFKHAVAARIQLDPAQLPWRTAVVEFLRAERSRGQRLVLATAAHISIAESVAAYLGLFVDVLATRPTDNLKGTRKAAAINEYTGGAEFDYLGDSWADLPVFAAARRSILVSADHRLIARVRQVSRALQLITP